MNALLVFLVEDNCKIREQLVPALEVLGGATVMAVASSEDEAIDWLAHNTRGNGIWPSRIFFWNRAIGLAWSDGAMGEKLASGWPS